jgi:hypothetical protein
MCNDGRVVDCWLGVGNAQTGPDYRVPVRFTMPWKVISKQKPNLETEDTYVEDWSMYPGLKQTVVRLFLLAVFVGVSYSTQQHTEA